jgi:hypothetical protein
MNNTELADLAPYAGIFKKVIDGLKSTPYGEVGVSLKLHAGRVVSETHTVTAQSLHKEAKGGEA